MGGVVPIFTIGINAHNKGTYLNLRQSDVRYCVSKPIVCCSAGAAWRLIYGRLNWKLKISNVADNADITQSQARYTRHRRMQEIKSLCMDSRPLRVNTVLCHFTQYSLLVCFGFIQ